MAMAVGKAQPGDKVMRMDKAISRKSGCMIPVSEDFQHRDLLLLLGLNRQRWDLAVDRSAGKTPAPVLALAPLSPPLPR